MFEKKYYHNCYSSIIVYSYNFINLCNCVCKQQEQQQQDQAAYFIVQNTSKSMQDPLQGNKSSKTQLEIKRSGSQPSTKGSEEYFTGTVRIDPLFQTKDPARAVGASVTFEPNARTAWHTHPLGQTLIVTAGCGLVQIWDGPVEKICPGDVVWIPLVKSIGMVQLLPLP